MPSPFSGMDPYLEETWMGVHSQLVAEIARQLAPKLRPRYIAHMTERVVVTTPEEDDAPRTGLYPDVVQVVKVDVKGPSPQGGAVAAAPLTLATVLPEAVLPEAVPHFSVEIRDTQHRRLVAAIEVLSPANKRGAGREEYLAKRGHVLRSGAHLLEIDLLRKGVRVPMLQVLPPVPYFVFLCRAQEQPNTRVWPITLRDRLPAVPVPLLSGDPDVPLDLEQALTNVYDLLSYDLTVDYAKPPPGRLAPEDAAWVDDVLRAAGKRR